MQRLCRVNVIILAQITITTTVVDAFSAVINSRYYQLRISYCNQEIIRLAILASDA